MHLLRFLVWADGPTFLQSSGTHTSALGGEDHRWMIVVVVILKRMISMSALSMKWIGYSVEFVLNLLYVNGNLIGLLFNFIQGTINLMLVGLGM